MEYISLYESPLGMITMAADENGLIGLWFEGEKYFGNTLTALCEEKETAVLEDTKRWLDTYFKGNRPKKIPDICLKGTAFQKIVWQILLKVPYGRTVTYGMIAKEVAKRSGKLCMSSQAVGGAVGHNPISLIVPCHRVIGSDGNLTGYAGGLERKIKLLQLEGHSMDFFYKPRKGTAL